MRRGDDAPARLLPEHHPRAGPDRRRRTGLFQQALGSTKLEPKTFNAGPAAIEALFSGAIDATYIGPNPAINGWATSKGTALKIIAGSTSGGAGLVVKPGINTPADLKGKKIATPQLGNTQDVALRAWLKANGLNADQQGGGDVSVLPQDNATAAAGLRPGRDRRRLGAGAQPEPDDHRVQGQAAGRREDAVAERRSSSPPT